MKKIETNSRADKIKLRKKRYDEFGLCDRCPPHDFENRRKRPKSDKYKTSRKGR